MVAERRADRVRIDRHPARKQQPGRSAYTRWRPTARTGGSKPGEATAAHRRPQWSPDGEQLAFVKGEVGGIQAIYVVVADGSRDQQRLADTVSAPSWSPDGARIAYAKADGDEVALYTIAADGTDARRLVAIRGWQNQSPNGEVDPAKAWIRKVSWSPDGSKIMVLENERAYPGIQVIGADGSDPELVAIDNPVPESVEDAAWSPDGTRIAMVGDFGRQGADDPTKWIALLTIGADGTGLRVLVGRRGRRQSGGAGYLAGRHFRRCGLPGRRGGA